MIGRGFTRTNEEVRSDDEELLIRLRLLGATPGQVDEIVSESHDGVSRWSDTRLLRLIAEHHRNGDDETPPSAPLAPAPGIAVTGTVTQVLEWVGEDIERAIIAKRAEMQGRQRPTLLAALDRVLD